MNDILAVFFPFLLLIGVWWTLMRGLNKRARNTLVEIEKQNKILSTIAETSEAHLVLMQRQVSAIEKLQEIKK